MNKLIWAALAAAVIWAGLWFWQANALRAEIDTWFGDKRAEGWTAEAEDISVQGFPNRLDARFTGLILAPEDGPRWEVPELQIMRLIYDADHLILAASGGQRLFVGSQEILIDGEGLRASAVTEGDALDRIAIEATRLDLIRPGQSNIHLRDVTGAAQAVAGVPQSWRVALNAAPVGPDATAPGTERVTLNATLGLDGEITDNPQLQSLELAALDYSAGAARLGLSGDLRIDARGRISGPLTLEAEDWRALLDRAGKDGRLPGEVVPLLQNVFNVVAGLSGSGDDLDLTLRIDKGRVSVGPLTIGKLPRLR